MLLFGIDFHPHRPPKKMLVFSAFWSETGIFYSINPCSTVAYEKLKKPETTFWGIKEESLLRTGPNVKGLTLNLREYGFLDR